jgi:hypothetical protein
MGTRRDLSEIYPQLGMRPQKVSPALKGRQIKSLSAARTCLGPVVVYRFMQHCIKEQTVWHIVNGIEDEYGVKWIFPLIVG